MKKFLLLMAIFCLIGWCVKAQGPVADSLTKIIHLDEVIISVNRSEEKKSDVPYQVELIKPKDVELLTPQTSADMLQNTGTVFVQKSQQGGGSPVLRGFEASRVLMVMDGVRLNNAVYRAGHLQDVITVDHSMLERTEVIFGPSSVMYGSDALGGVMHFYTKKPEFGIDKMLTKGHSYVRWSSVNEEMTGHLDFNLGWKKLSSLTSFTYSDFSDIRAGNTRSPFFESTPFTRDYYVETINGVDSMIKNSNRNVQKFSGYSQYDILQKFAFKPDEKVLYTLNFQYSNSSDIPRYDRLTEYAGSNLRFAEWYYGPQTRIFTSLNSEIKSGGKLFDKMNVILAWQSISQDRINRRFNNPDKTFQFEDVAVYSLNADFGKTLKEKHELHYGLEAQFNDVQSEAKTVNIETSAETPFVTRYPDGGSTMNTYAAYFTHRWKASEKFIMTEGIRFSASSLSANFTDTTFFPFPFTEIDQSSSAVTGNLGFIYSPASDWRITLLGSSGFRTPNVDDLTKIFESTAGLLIVPNPDLEPENAYNAELTLEKTCFDGTTRFSLTGWYTKLVNAMVLKDFQLNGQDSVLYGGSPSIVQAMQNADDAYIEGITGTFMADFNEHFSFLGTATYTYGRYNDTENDTVVPLDHIPPAFGKFALIFRDKIVDAEFYSLFNGWKRMKDYSPSGEDNAQYATIYGMPSWITLNVKASWKISKIFTVQTGLENIMDTHYRYFASGISAAGRNLSLTLRAKF
jgi:hemoglobin/transferrin/lactoferrin receptor protein